MIGVGNALRHDDAAGLETARALRARAERERLSVHEQEGECLGLLEQWHGAAGAVLVDAVQSGARNAATPGRVRRLDASATALATGLSSSSTHAFGLAEAVELARSLGRLPQRVVVYGIEGRCFSAGVGLSAEVRAAIPALADAVLDEALRIRAAVTAR